MGPWHVLCDNESFLTTAESRKAHRDCKVKLWHVPAKSPDLNPVEKFWSWVRKQLRARDFADLKAGRPVPGKTAYKQRLRAVLRSPKAQKVAKAIAKSFRKTCAEVSSKGGAGARG